MARTQSRWWRGAAVSAALVLLAPGWRGTLTTVRHGEVLAAAAAAPADAVLGVEVVDGDGRTWHAQYVDRGGARLLRALGATAGIVSLLPPDHAARIRAGRPVTYYRVERTLHWPWWRPGGGMAWGPAAE